MREPRCRGGQGGPSTRIVAVEKNVCGKESDELLLSLEVVDLQIWCKQWHCLLNGTSLQSKAFVRGQETPVDAKKERQETGRTAFTRDTSAVSQRTQQGKAVGSASLAMISTCMSLHSKFAQWRWHQRSPHVGVSKFEQLILCRDRICECTVNSRGTRVVYVLTVHYRKGSSIDACSQHRRISPRSFGHPPNLCTQFFPKLCGKI